MGKSREGRPKCTHYSSPNHINGVSTQSIWSIQCNLLTWPVSLTPQRLRNIFPRSHWVLFWCHLDWTLCGFRFIYFGYIWFCLWGTAEGPGGEGRWCWPARWAADQAGTIDNWIIGSVRSVALTLSQPLGGVCGICWFMQLARRVVFLRYFFWPTNMFGKWWGWGLVLLLSCVNLFTTKQI